MRNVALLRAVNVAGRARIAMTDVREALVHNFIEAQLGVAATSRNGSTVSRIGALARGPSDA